MLGVAAGYAEATKLTTLQEPLNLADPPCPHFGVCGSCNYQNLQYHAQLEAKQQQVLETLQHIGGISNCDDVLLPIIPCQQPCYYRSNMQCTFSMAPTFPFQPWQTQLSSGHSLAGSTCAPSDIAKRLIVGLHKANDPSEIVPVQTCFLQHDSASVLLQAAAQAVAQSPPMQAEQLSLSSSLYFSRKSVNV